MWAKPSSTDLMAFLLQESLGLQEEMEGAGEVWAKRDLDKAREAKTFLPNQKQNAGYSGS